MEKIKAVLTADVVNSSLLSKAEMYALKRAVEKILRSRDLQFSFYRGDSFNAICELSEALKLVAVLRTTAIKKSDEVSCRFIDIRIAVGLGTVDEPFREMSAAKGDAFVLSGREMDNMEKDGPRLIIRCQEPVADLGMSALSMFADYILSKLTVRQSGVIYELLMGATQVKAAKKLRKSQSTINKHAHAADWKQLEKVLELYERLVATSFNHP